VSILEVSQIKKYGMSHKLETTSPNQMLYCLVIEASRSTPKMRQNRSIRTNRLHMAIQTSIPKKKNLSKFISSRRSMVEHVFKRLKDWKIIGGLSRHYVPKRQNNSIKNDYLNLDHIMDVLCCIHNIDIQSHPLRA